MLSAQFVPQDVRFWHPWEDYIKSYSVQKKLGGGAQLTLYHDLDSAIFLFGNPTTYSSIKGLASNSNNLTTNADDWSIINLLYESHSRKIPVTITANYHSSFTHDLRLFLDDATVADYNTGLVTEVNLNNSIRKQHNFFVDRDFCFRELIKDVLNKQG